ncbi:hypothetical protein PORY_002751 [Pneumocystis oryctolagi]|uniref:Uncharacterized protein n=1 Tax=Pneumocystis oryctolagi TaxID=42067 RepID=A0ACB7C8K7_9ASCO|nr:hypothetical protein PORY_002751 [Pneumocystis oryctolagi]
MKMLYFLRSLGHLYVTEYSWTWLNLWNYLASIEGTEIAEEIVYIGFQIFQTNGKGWIVH